MLIVVMGDSATRYIVGCMTGTSLDGLDCALVAIEGSGLNMSVKLIETVQHPLGALADLLRQLATEETKDPIACNEAARWLGELHSDAVEQLTFKDAPIDFIVAHGQTILHEPGKRISWQLFDPWPIVRKHEVPVCYDLRQADIAAGGQGAPITPLSDWILFRSQDARRIVNLGGICNVTDLPPNCTPKQVVGEDIGPCNLLIDGVVQRSFEGMMYDKDGRVARAGCEDSGVYEYVKQHPFFARHRPRSTGREDFSPAWLEPLMREYYEAAGADLVASAVDCVARLVAETCPSTEHVQLILAGGGAKNPVLVERIEHHAAGRAMVLLADDFGVPCEAREAMAMAILGALSADGVPITLPQVTGAKEPGVAGVWAGK